MTKPTLIRILAISFIITLCACSRNSGWQLVWQDDFNGNTIDPNTWSYTERGNADWQKWHTSSNMCYEIGNGKLVLKGIVNPDRDADTARFLTGGICTKDLHAFDCGRIEVRARIKGAKGAWPAIWLLPFDYKTHRWPRGGEIDIMERLNHDSIAYQTVHSYYTKRLKHDKAPQRFVMSRINPDGFNTYGVDITPDSLVFHVNGKRTLAYPKIKTDLEGQYPFYIPQYLLIDMQLGGEWVGPIDPAELPATMEIDWVRHYQDKKQINKTSNTKK